MKEAPSIPVSFQIFYGLGSVIMILGVLYFGKPVLLPIALSVLLAFILNPLVQYLELWRLGRIAAVLIASGIAFGVIGLATWALASQVQLLAADLPNHQHEIKQKIESFRTSETSTFGRLNSMFRELFPEDEELAKADEAKQKAEEKNKGIVEKIFDGESSEPEPVFVVRQPTDNANSLTTATGVLLSMVAPLGMAALVIVLVIFLLLRREDVRYRAISLLGDAALTGTTRLMRDAADRVSRYLLTLLGVNTVFGLWFGFGLYFIGVPYAPLWGFLTLCFRFIPFVGSPVSVLLPLLISIATSDGWAEPAWVLVFFGISELVTANIIEPILFGKSTGLTPIALLIAVLFWTWVWGPIGLLLSTPLTVCLVVLGQHIPQLRSLKVLLAEQPVLDAKLQFFQRLLAGDANEGHRVFTEYAKEMGCAKAYDDVIVPALIWTRRERDRQSISPVEENFIFDSTKEAVALSIAKDVAKRNEAISDDAISSDPAEGAPGEPVRRLNVYCHPVHHESEEIAISMLSDLIVDRCDVYQSNTKKLPSKVVDEIASGTPDVVVLSIIPPGGIPQAKFLCREIRSRCPDLCVIVAQLSKLKNYDDLLVALREEGATFLTTTLVQTTNQIDSLIGNLEADEINTLPAESVTRIAQSESEVEFAE